MQVLEEKNTQFDKISPLENLISKSEDILPRHIVNCSFFLWLCYHDSEIPNPQLGKYIPYWRFDNHQIWDIIPNFEFHIWNFPLMLLLWLRNPQSQVSFMNPMQPAWVCDALPSIPLHWWCHVLKRWIVNIAKLSFARLSNKELRILKSLSQSHPPLVANPFQWTSTNW